MIGRCGTARMARDTGGGLGGDAVVGADVVAGAEVAATALLDSRGVVVRWSPAAEQLLGHPAAQVLGRPAVELLARPERPQPPRRHGGHCEGHRRHGPQS